MGPMRACARFIEKIVSKIQGKPLKKLGLGSRVSFISPYLRRPLRPLHKVLSERAEGEEMEQAVLHRGDLAGDATSATPALAAERVRTSD